MTRELNDISEIAWMGVRGEEKMNSRDRGYMHIITTDDKHNESNIRFLREFLWLRSTRLYILILHTLKIKIVRF